VRVGLAVGILLCFSFVLLLLVHQFTLSLQEKYPETECDGEKRQEEQEKQSYREFQEFKEAKRAGKPYQMSGSLSCFCAQSYSKWKSTRYGQNLDEFTDDSSLSDTQKQLCKEWALDNVTWKPVLSQLVALSVALVNLALKYLVIHQSHEIGFQTVSQQAQYIRSSVFLAQFINTAVLLFFLNLENGLKNLGLGLIDGQNSAYTQEWFQTSSGTLVYAMVFTSGFPILEYLLFMLERVFSRVRDRALHGFCGTKVVTKRTTISAYLNYHQAPTFPIHFKYSFMMNIVFVSFMYGAGIPLLFVIALVSFALFYCVERLILVYVAEHTRSYEETLNESTIDFMMVAPLLFVGNGFWQYASIESLNTGTPLARDNLSEPVLVPKSFLDLDEIWASKPLFYAFFLLLCLIVF